MPALIALFAALVAIRIQIAFDMGVSPKTAWNAAIGAGFLLDLAIAMLALGLARMAGLGQRALHRGLIVILAAVVWGTSLSNALYYRFFGSALEWWTVLLHWRDIGALADSIGELFTTPLFVLSVALFVSSLVLAWRGVPARTSFAKSFLAGLAVFGLSLLVKQSPVWVHWLNPSKAATGSILNAQILFRWEVDGLASQPGARYYRHLKDFHGRDEAIAWAPQKLARFRGLGPENFEHPTPWYAAPKDAKWPLLVDFVPDANRTRQLRAEFGLPAEGPLLVSVVLVESLRAYELFDAVRGPQIYPNLTRLMASNAVTFRRTYAYGFTAGATVRGKFSTLCSMLPDPMGPATYLAHPATRTICLAEFLKRQGFETLSFTTDPPTFHGVSMFESLHGFSKVYDHDYFEKRGVKRTIGTWGLDDGPFLDEVLRKQTEVLGQGRSLFSAAMTISTHFPWTQVKGLEVKLDREMKNEKHGSYAGYLSRFRYLDRSLGNYLDQVFKSPIGDRTLVVVLGDHSAPVEPDRPLSDFRLGEVHFRIPLLLFSKHLKKARSIDTPITQLDVAPTIAEILGYSGPVTWLGRPAFSGSGSAWMFSDRKNSFYRIGADACHAVAAESGDSERTCKSTPLKADPMAAGDTLDRDWTPPSATDDLIRSFMLATAEVLNYNLLTPPVSASQKFGASE